METEWREIDVGEYMYTLCVEKREKYGLFMCDGSGEVYIYI